MEIKRYCLGETEVWYLINKKGNASMLLIPKESAGEVKAPWDLPKPEGFNPRARYARHWQMGSLVYFYTSELDLEHPGLTMKASNITENIIFKDQEVLSAGEKTEIKTTLTAYGYTLLHTLVYREGCRGFECKTEFLNTSKEAATLRMLSSFALDNLSPFQENDAPDTYKFHRFYGGWSKEGKHSVMTIEDMALEKSWGGWNSSSERFGSHGSYPVQRYFSTSAFEDSKAGVLWGAQLAINSTWQTELSRFGDTLSLTGGLGDYSFSGWEKVIAPGESFAAPTAYIAAAKGDIFDVCAALCDMQKDAYFKYGEVGLPVTFNEYCATWGRPTQEKMLKFAETLQDFDVKYIVIDAGWCKEGCEQDSNGEWLPDKKIFPDMKEMNKKIRDMGMIPGLWFEFEVTTKGSALFEKEYDDLHLTRDKRVIKTSGIRSYLDLRKPEVKAHLHNKVTKLLKENGFGYIKVDYNRNLGITVDGEESGAEELRKQMECVREFFAEMKEEIPDLIIENCASGGHRLEPSMFAVSAVSSFSDAHEAVEIPYIAANLHNLMLPAQESIWAVLHSDDSEQREVYSLAATFLGRVCLSGDVASLNERQKQILKNALAFYKKLENVIINGNSRLYGNRGNNTRYPKGTQALWRATDKEAMIVCHSFENAAEEFSFEIPSGFEICDSFGEACITVLNNTAKISKMKDFSAGAVYLKKKKN